MATPAKDQKLELEKELEIYRAIKPYIGHCLTLNHDLNNPLAGIIGYCEFLIEEADNLSEEQKGYLNQISKCAVRMQKLIENLCEEKIALEENVDLKSIVESYKQIAKDLD